MTTAVRNVVYRMFLYNTPFSVFNIKRSVPFRLVFGQDGRFTDVQVDSLSLLPYGGGPPL